MVNDHIFSNILVTYVKPTNKETAFNMGLTMAKTNNAKLSVVEFLQPEPPDFLFFRTKQEKDEVSEQKHIVLETLKKFEEKAKQENVMLKTSFKSTETLVDSIIQYVESHKIDLLIVDHPHMSHSEETHYNDVVNAIHAEVNCNMLTLK
ncbi:MAG: universal stress protein [Nitrosopumilus sp.]|nr:universal stress protein [Nitrosopumilus sp.]MDH3515374.1 universal stress protein [Nitrosopumilus sp.]MDH3564325.1 universal stress protein [Nitrosopumilus sp.]MDH5417142.1 universal stress protein [Nitrosopumilus sp.]MDH5555005.1 universal stress protein [Nitrosopumilus sp.]